MNADDANFCEKCGHDFRPDNSTPNILSILLGILAAAAFAALCLILSETMVWLVLVFFILMMARGIGPVAAIILLLIFPIASIPYWLRLRQLRPQLRKSGSTRLEYAFRWFLKGPFAYRDLRALENSGKAPESKTAPRTKTTPEPNAAPRTKTTPEQNAAPESLAETTVSETTDKQSDQNEV